MVGYTKEACDGAAGWVDFYSAGMGDGGWGMGDGERGKWEV